jgi:hypothetical protein
MIYDNYSKIEKERKLKKAQIIVKEYRTILIKDITISSKEAFSLIKVKYQISRDTLYRWLKLF